MGCKFSKNKILPVVEPIQVWCDASPMTIPKVKAKKGLAKGKPGKKNPVNWDAPPPDSNDASTQAGNPSSQAEPTCVMESPKLQPAAEKEKSIADHTPIRLVKEADISKQEVTPNCVLESHQGTLVIKRGSQGSLKTDALLSAGSRDSGICLAAGENDEYANVITEKSSPEKQELAKVPNSSAPDLTIQGMYIQPPYRPSQAAKLGAITSRRPPSGLPPLPVALQRQPPPLQEPNEGKDDKLKLLSIVERPSSRGGMAFDISFDDSSSSAKRKPRALEMKMKTSSFTKEELKAKLDAADQRRKAWEEERKEKIRAQLEHDRQVMNALEAFQKAQTTKTEAQLNKKMAANEEKREQHFRELKNRLKEKNDKMMAAVDSKKVKVLRPPVIKEQLD